MAIAVGLLVIALVVFAEGTHALVVAPPDEQFAVAITRAVNSALFIVVVLELVRTIIARLEGGALACVMMLERVNYLLSTGVVLPR